MLGFRSLSSRNPFGASVDPAETTGLATSAELSAVVNPTTVALGDSGDALAVSMSGGAAQTATISEATTITVTGAAVNGVVTLALTQGSGGGFGVTFSGIAWAWGNAPDMSEDSEGDVSIVKLIELDGVVVASIAQRVG